jgi:DNA helicase-2/ATP-dependent DNA helicase PcrA
VVHAESVDEESLPEESPLIGSARGCTFPYDPLEGPVDPRTGARLRLTPGRRLAMDQAADMVRGYIEEPHGEPST